MSREELIAAAAKAIRFAYADEMYSGMAFEASAEAALAVFEKAHTPSGDEREALDRAVRSVTWNASNYPDKAQPGILGADIGTLTAKIVDAVESAGFRRTVQDEPTDAQVRLARINDLLGELDLNGGITAEGTACGSILREALALSAFAVTGQEGGES